MSIQIPRVMWHTGMGKELEQIEELCSIDMAYFMLIRSNYG